MGSMLALLLDAGRQDILFLGGFGALTGKGKEEKREIRRAAASIGSPSLSGAHASHLFVGLLLYLAWKDGSVEVQRCVHTYTS